MSYSGGITQPTTHMTSHATAKSLTTSERAVWFIEHSLDKPLTLELIASACFVSQFQLARAFVTRTGWSVMQYVRARRLTEAAKRLVEGQDNILQLALQSGYSSHEAFSRAFADHFQHSPKSIRNQADLSMLELNEPLRMVDTQIIELATPRIETPGRILTVGLAQTFSHENNHTIGLLWQRFMTYQQRIPHLVNFDTFGVVRARNEEEFDYVASMEVSSFLGAPKELQRVEIPPQKYLVFDHKEHISRLHNTIHTAMNKWLPESDYTMSNSIHFARIQGELNLETGLGNISVWIPIL